MIETALMPEYGAAADDALRRWSLPTDSFSGARRRSLLARAMLGGCSFTSEFLRWLDVDAEPRARSRAR